MKLQVSAGEVGKGLLVLEGAMHMSRGLFAKVGAQGGCYELGKRLEYQST